MSTELSSPAGTSAAVPAVPEVTSRVLDLACSPSRLDSRDWYFTPMAAALAGLPEAVDLREVPGAFPEVYDQGVLNSCTACAAAAALHFDMRRRASAAFLPSRLFIYFNERKVAGTLSLDPLRGKPVEMVDCLKSLREAGICAEELWPYNPKRLDLRPSPEAYEAAERHRGISYLRVRQQLGQLKACLAQGYPFLFGARIFSPFLGAQVRQTGQVPMPGAKDRLLGAHALLAVGYDDARQVFIVRNSQGKGWGDSGHAYLPYAYLTDPRLTFDHWVLTQEHASSLPATLVDGAPLPRSMPLGMADALPAAETLPRSWRFANPYGALSNPLVMAGDRLIGVSGSTLFAIDIYRGKESGTTDEVEQEGFPYSFQSFFGSDPHVAVGGGVVYFMDGDDLKALQLSDGQPIEGWVSPMIAQVASLAVQEGLLVAVNLDPLTGTTQMTGFDAVSGQLSFGPVNLSTASAGQVGYGEGAAFFVADGALYAVNTDFGDPRWTFKNTTGGSLDGAATPRVTSDTVVAVSGAIHGIDLVTGVEKWTVPAIAGGAWSSPVLDASEDFGVASNTTGEVVAFSLSDGSVLWRLSVSGVGAVSLQGSTVYASSNSGQTLTVIDAEAGEYRARYSLPGIASQATPVVGNGTLFIPADDGSITALPYSAQVAAYFDGIKSRVDIAADGPQFDFGLEDFTVEAWVKSSQGGEIVSSYPTAGGAEDHGFRLNLGTRGELQLAIVNSTGSQMNVASTSATTAVDGEWHHIVLLRREGELIGMVDGLAMQMLVSSDTGTPDAAISIGGKNALTLGAYVPGPGLAAEDHFAGLLREVRIWDRALDITTLQSNLVRELTGQEPRLLGYWRLDENHAAPTDDARPEVPPTEPRNAVAAHRYTSVFRYGASCPSDLVLDRSAFPYLLHEEQVQWPYSGTWAARGEEPAITPAAYNDAGAIAFGTENALYGVRASDGHRLWGIDVDEGASALVASGSYFYALTGQESLIAIDALTGEKTQVDGFNGLVTQAADTLAAPAVSGPYLAAAAPSGEVRIQSIGTSDGAGDDATGVTVVKASVGVNPTGLTFVGSTLALIAGASGHRMLYLVDLSNGSTRSLAVAADLLCAAGSWLLCVGQGGLQRVDPALGRAVASSSEIALADITGLAAFPDRNLLAVSTASGTLHGLSLATLAPRWTCVVPQGTAGTSHALNAPVFDEAGRVFVTSRSGAAVAVDGNDGALCGLYQAPQPILTAPLVHAGTVVYPCADPEDATATLDGALHSVVFGETTALRLGLDQTGKALSGANTYALVEADATDATLHLMDVNRCCVEAWINAPVGGGGGIVSVCPTDAGGFDVNLSVDSDGTLRFTARCREQDGWRMLSAQAPTPLVDGKWHHVAASRESEERVVLYVDGVVLDGVTQQVTTGATPAALVPGLKVYLGALGGDDHSATQPFRGLIAEVRIWDTYLVAPELASRMHVKLRGSEADLLAYWNFDHACVHDGAYQGHDGVVVNASGAPDFWLTELPFEHPSYPYLETVAAITQEGEAGQTGELAETVYALTLKACRADGAGLPNHPIDLWYVQHAGDPDTIEVSGTALKAVAQKDEQASDEAAAPAEGQPAAVCSVTTGADGVVKVLVKTSQLDHGPTLDVRAGFMPANERFHVNVLLNNQALAKPAPPTLTAQTKLIQDYHYSDGGKIDETRDRSTYRTIIKATNPDGTGRPNEPVTLWASLDVDVEAAGVTYHLNASNSVILKTDANGELTVVSEAADLSTPNLYARAGFMHRNDRVVLAPDQDLHQQLTQVQGADLTEAKTTNWSPAAEQSGEKSSLFSSEDEVASADDSASAIRQVMSAAAPPPSATATQTQPAGTLAASATVPSLDTALTQQRLEAMRQPQPSPKQDVVVPLRTLGHVRRKAPVNPDALRSSLGDNVGFVFEVTPGAKAPRYQLLATQEELDKERGTATSAATSTALGSWLKKAWKSCKHVAHDAASGIKNACESAYKIVISPLEDAIQVAVHWADGVVHSAIKSIEEAAAAVGGFFKQLGKMISQVIQFLRELLNWGGILKTHRILKNVVKSGAKAAAAHLKDADTIRDAFSAIREVLGAEPVDVASTSLTDVQSQAGSADNPAASNTDSVKGKMMAHKSTERGQRSASPVTGELSDTPLNQDLHQLLEELMSIMGDLKSMSFSALLKDLMSLVKTLVLTVMDAIVEGIITIAAALAAAIEWVVKALDTKLNIPWVSALYKWLTGDDLSMLDVLCLMAAVPINLVYGVMTRLSGKMREFYDDNYGMPDNILAAAGLSTGSSTALGMADPIKEVEYYGPEYAGTTNKGIEVTLSVFRFMCVVLGGFVDLSFNVERARLVASGAPLEPDPEESLVASFKIYYGVFSLLTDSLLFFFSNPRVQNRLLNTLEDCNAPTSDINRVGRWWAAGSISVFICSGAADLATACSGFYGVYKSMGGGSGSSVLPKWLQFNASTLDLRQYQLLMSLAVGNVGNVIYKIYGLAIYNDLLQQVPNDVRKEVYLLSVRDLVGAMPKFFSWMYTGAGVTRFNLDELTVYVASMARMYLNLTASICHTVGIFTYDKDL